MPATTVQTTTIRGRRRAACAVLMVVLAVGPGLRLYGAVPAERVERTAWLMGTRATVAVEGRNREAAIAASEAALRAMRAVEDRLSTWKDDSELSHLNRTPPGQVGIGSEALSSLLAEMALWSAHTDGAFHPAVGALVDAWDLRGDGRVPDADELGRSRDASGDAGVSIDAVTGHVVRRDARAWLDAGAFGKGAALREARRALEGSEVRWARVDLGGQILVVGDAPTHVAVAHPEHRDRVFTELGLTDASVATSGQSERGIDVDGVRFGHLVDPRTGQPVPAWGAVTVVDSDPVVADVLATALFVLGPDAGLRLAESLGVAALFLVTGEERVSELWTSALDYHRSPSSPAPHRHVPPRNIH